MDYIKIPAVTEKLKLAEAKFAPVWISAPTGYGKTAAVNDYYAFKSILCLTGINGRLNQMPEFSKIRQSTVFIDDVSFITDCDSRRYISDLLCEKGLQTLLASRGKFPEWLEDLLISLNFVFLSEDDFCLHEKQIMELFECHGVTLKQEECDQITECCKGYPVAALFYRNHIASGEDIFSPALTDTVWEDVFRFWDRRVFDGYDSEIWNFLLAVAVYPEFSEDFAASLTGSRCVSEYLSYLQKTGQFLIRVGRSVWKFRPEAERFLRWKRKHTYTAEKQRDNYYRAAFWYEQHDDISRALEYYSLAEAEEQMTALLIRNAARHPGTGHYYDTRKYYDALPEQTICENPVLICGMSMLRSLVMDPQGSEYWYAKLKEYSENSDHPRHLRKEARNKLVYLDIALPHRAGKGIIGILKNAFARLRSGEIKLPEFSVTSNLPSLMNGGLDFCVWSKNDNAIARFLGHPIEIVLGKTGKGLVDIALSESYFEKGTADPYEIVTRLNNGIADAANDGKIELIFAATGFLIKQHLLQGQYPTAKRRLDMFRQKISEEQATQLLPNFQAFCAWFSLYTNDKNEIRAYLGSAPDEKKSFYVLDRYRYIVKIRCLIAEDRLTEALDLACFLTGYFQSYQRTYMTIENNIMKAIILYRMENEKWQEVLTDALRSAEDFHFVRVFSLEGAAVLPLLMHYNNKSISRSFMKDVMDESKKMALAYPDYLQFMKKPDIYLTDRETQVLGLLCQGLSMQEICKLCSISYDGLKKHNRNIYQKLGAKNRVDAERKAMQLGLIHRKGGVQ